MSVKTTEKADPVTPANLSHTRIWDELKMTDPKQTKPFSRAGGFKGTATKPIWTSLRMTEYFGPCGIGWGMDKPEHTTLLANTEGLVFCTTGLWYIDPATGERGQVYGVGGDKFLISQSNGLRTSDEAFKAAYTDALSNAMKQIGVCADIHMGLFEDNKYVSEARAEYAEDPQTAAPLPAPVPPVAPLPEVDEMTAEAIIQAVQGATAVEGISLIINGTALQKMKALKEKLPAKYAEVIAEAGKRKKQLTPTEGTSS
jgi:hypothetical protein